MKINVISSFHDLPEETGTLFDEVSKSSFFLSKEWFENYEKEVISSGITEAIYCFIGDNNTIGVIPLCEKIEKKYGISISVLEAMGNYYTSLFGLIGNDEVYGKTISEKLVSQLAKNKSINVLHLRPLANDTIFFHALVKSLSENNWYVEQYCCFGNWYLNCRGTSYDEYLASRPSKLRNNIKRKSKQFEKKGGELVLVKSFDGLPQALDDYEKVYNSSWKISEAYPGFIRGLVEYMAKNGELRLGVAYFDGKPVAAQIWFVSHGIASIFKLAYDEEYKKLSAGTVLTGFIMKHALDDDKVHEVDYLTGDDAYKKDWMSDRRERWGIKAYNKQTLKGKALSIGRLFKAAIGK